MLWDCKETGTKGYTVGTWTTYHGKTRFRGTRFFPTVPSNVLCESLLPNCDKLYNGEEGGVGPLSQ